MSAPWYVYCYVCTYVCPQQKLLLSSSQENGILIEHGLNDIGQQQALEAGKQLAPLLNDPTRPLVVLASPFSRTIQTAEGALRGMGLETAPIIPEPALRERYFGAQLELGSDSQYAPVWVEDAKDVGFVPGGDGESVAAVSARLQVMMDRLENEYDNAAVLLVGHCDTLAILEATVRETLLNDFRTYALRNCEFRRI